MRADKLGMLARWASLGPVSRIQSRAYVSHLLTSPEAVQRVLQDNPRNYRKDVRFSTIARPALGEGLFSSDGDKWRGQRRVAPAFHRQRLVAMTSAMADAIDTMLARWQRFAAAGAQFNLQAEVSRMRIDVIGRTLAGQGSTATRGERRRGDGVDL
jgi:cytochrome P450